MAPHLVAFPPGPPEIIGGGDHGAVCGERLLHEPNHVASAHNRTNAFTVAGTLPATDEKIGALLVERHGHILGHLPRDEELPVARTDVGHRVRCELDELQLLGLVGRRLKFVELAFQRFDLCAQLLSSYVRRVVAPEPSEFIGAGSDSWYQGCC